MSEWRTCPTHTVACLCEQYELLFPTRLYTSQMALTRLCGGSVDKRLRASLTSLSGCAALVQNKYLFRHNSIPEVFLFEILQNLKLMESVLPWYSPTIPKPLNESGEVQAYWDVPVYAERQEVRTNRLEARITDCKTKQVITLEKSCPRTGNRRRKAKRSP